MHKAHAVDARELLGIVPVAVDSMFQACHRPVIGRHDYASHPDPGLHGWHIWHISLDSGRPLMKALGN